MTIGTTSTAGSMKNFLKAALVTLLFVLICCVIILSLVPPVSKDALTHHLAVPKLYIQHGGMYEIPGIGFSYYPMNIELLYLIPLYFGNDIIPKLIHFIFALLTAWLIFCYLKKRLNMLYALFGSFFFLSIPVIIRLSITVYVDLGLIFFSTASLISLLKWIENHCKVKYLLVSACWCGLALGTKYNGLITFLLLTLFVPFIYLREVTPPVDLGDARKSNHSKLNPSNSSFSIQLKSIGYAVLFLVVSLVVFSPWMIRNTIWTNNPVYPLYNTYFNPPDDKSYFEIIADRVFESSNSQEKLNHFSLRSLMYSESWWQIALIPIRIFFEGQDGTPQYFDGKLNPLLFLLPFFAFFRSERYFSRLGTEKSILLAFSILFILLVFFLIDMRIRWIAPAIPPMVILSMFGIHEVYVLITDHFSEKRQKIFAGLVSAIILFLVALNVNYLLHQFRDVDPISYISGRVGRDDYIERYRREYPAIQFANKNLSENARILCLFLGRRQYYSDREMNFDEGVFLDVLKRSESSEGVQIHLRKRGITHLLVRYDLFNQWQIDNFDKRERENLAIFFHDCVNLLFSKNNYGLFELKDFS